eukprot:jgi/Tetstr1/439252/TSEL_027694.t1
MEMSMETAVPIDFQEEWAEAQCCVNERVVAAAEAGDPVVLDRALKWKYLLPQLLLRASSRGGRRRLQALAWRFRAFAERRMTELVRSWDDARTEAFYAGHARQRRTDADLFAALLVGTADTAVALVEDGELSRAAGRLSSKGMGDLSDPAILAQLRDKHPSRSHPIPDAAYDIPVDEAALTVDMRVPYQQLKQHVAAGPSGMRNEYLRCLVGEYAAASGPAAVRAMSEVASMYLQVGEAERRAAERAVVDNMKEAYVSVLAPSQLGVGIPAGDPMLIHGVRLIAEKLGPRRRAPLATTSFCVAIHPEVQQCDTTLEVNDGAARFNADDGFLVGLPEHVWPALHAFRTSIKASVGLEVRFDKMQAYCADMEAARREAPADIEWPEPDGHHGIAVLNVPLGSPQYVHAYMRGKAEELREEVDASLSKLLSAKPSRRWRPFAEAVDATILAAVERLLGVSFDPSKYGTDTNTVVTDFLAELLHDPDPMAAEVATLSIAVRREVDDLFQQAVPLGNTVPRDELKDLVPDAKLSLPAFNVVTGSYDPRSLKSALLEFKTMRYGVKYTAVPRATAVDRFERSLLGDIQRGLAARDAAWHNTEPGQKGPLRDILDMSEYTGMAFGTVDTSAGMLFMAAAAICCAPRLRSLFDGAGMMPPRAPVALASSGVQPASSQ